MEAHLNLTAQLTPARDGTLLPTDQQTHLTLEPTVGLLENLAVGFMFLSAWQPGYSPQFAGWRVLPHFYAPKSWRLPVRPILDREFSRWQVVFNPVFERALHGPGTAHGWNFEPALLLRWKRSGFSPSLEYHGEIESIDVPPRAQPEGHQLFAGGDWRVNDGFMINMGTGFDLGSRGPGIILKSRFEWDWKSGSHDRAD